MKNKIKQFSKGDFQVKQPDIRFSETQICISAGEGEVYEGSFLIENTKDGTIRGLIYPSSFRVRFLEEGFDGNPVKVNFLYDTAGMKPGEIEQGTFTVVCNGGEYDLAFMAVIEKPYMMSSIGKIQTVEDFKHLAALDFDEAKKLFRMRQFSTLLKYEDCRIINLYENMRTWSLDEQALEEFLVGIKQKEKIFLTLSAEHIEEEDVLEQQKSVLTITKNTWGFAQIEAISSDSFIELKRHSFTTDDFVGNSYQLEYMIRPEYLHAGYNYGRISVSTPYETLSIDVRVHQRGHRDEMRTMKGMIAGQGLKDYLSFVAGKVPLGEWMQKAIKRVDHLKELEPNNEYYSLLQAHIYLRAGKEEEAAWILDNRNYSRFTIGRKPEITAYYIFLTALLKKETLHTNRVLEEIYRIYMKHPYTWQLLCMIIHLDTKYRDYTDRLRVLERQFFNGANQLLLYAEAYICFQEKVALLRKLDSFEIQILNFATKYQLLTRDLAIQTADLACRQKKYNQKLLRILDRAYKMYNEPLILKAICMQLIQGNKSGFAYFKWYEAAVKKEMKIAQLYEFYMMSVQPDKIRGAFPRIVYLYFLQGMTLDHHKTALLYANILTYETEDSDIYRQYKEQMRAFATEQLLLRRIDDSLRVIYNRFINPNTISPNELDAMYDIAHTYQITTKVRGMKYVLVIEKDGKVKQRVPYKAQRGANIYLYDKESRIVWEADNGLHYTDSIPYDARRLFYEIRFADLFKNYRTIQAEASDFSQNVTLSFEHLKQYGMKPFDEQEIFLLCTKRIREQDEVEDDFLLYLSYELVKDGFYDKAILSYLSQYYCGATANMKLVWRKAREYGVYTKALAERIITQMLFSETMYGEEEIFEDYYTGRAYFRLKQAYLAYIARGYVVKHRDISETMIRIMVQELMQKEYLADICKVALLKYYAGREVEEALETLLRECFMATCEKQMVFSFYVSYPHTWLRELQLYDKVFVEYHARLGGKVKIYYRVQSEGEIAGDYQAETLLPVYDDVYVKEFVLYEGENLKYYFEETSEQETISTDKKVQQKQHLIYEDGKFGRLNLMSRLSKDKQYEAMLAYKKEEQIACEVLRMY